MNWNDHSKLKGQHSFLSPSSVTWLHYDEDAMADKLHERYASSIRVEIGTALHAFAADCIELRQKLPKELTRNSRTTIIQMIRLFFKAKEYSNSVISYVTALPDYVFITLINYVNDCIGFKMDVEQILFHSYNCFGTTDAISFRDNVLRISDLKTGDTPAHMEQLLIYAGLFCLEYHVKPIEISIELRLYQSGNTIEYLPDIQEMTAVMDRIVKADNIITSFKEGK